MLKIWRFANANHIIIRWNYYDLENEQAFLHESAHVFSHKMPILTGAIMIRSMQWHGKIKWAEGVRIGS